jgi:23S rRNA (guanosine2251-2'-O)-methyltransferase
MKSDHLRQRRKTSGLRQERRVELSANIVRIFGTHAVKAALKNPQRTVCAVYATPNAMQWVSEAIADRHLTIHSVTPKDLDRMLGEDTVHQGVLLEAAPLPEPSMDILESAKLVLLLDQVTDPHNVGAILRSAAAFGVDALIMTARHSPPLQGTLAKAASGGLEHVPVLTPTNLARTLHLLGELGFVRVGLDSGSETVFEDYARPERLALVLGAEDRGLRRLTIENCDAICSLTAPGAIQSLNVSNAAVIALYVTTQRKATQIVKPGQP